MKRIPVMLSELELRLILDWSEYTDVERGLEPSEDKLVLKLREELSTIDKQ